MEKNNNEEIEIDLRELFGVLLSRIYIIIGVGIIFAVAAGLITKLCITPQYQSTACVYVLSKGADTGSSVSSALTSLTDLQMGSQVLVDYETMVVSRSVMNEVIDNLELDMDYKQLRSMISMNNPENTRTLEITVTHPDPVIAKEIVDEVAKVSCKFSAKVMDIQSPYMYEAGDKPEGASSPNTSKNVLIAAIAGLLLAAVVVVVRYLLNDTIQSQEEVEKYLGLNTLGLIPIEEGSMEQLKKDRKKRKKDMK